MEPKMFCQSCTMPIDNPDDRGTERNGAKNEEYCKYCYQNGEFTEPNLTFAKMKSVVEEQMKKMNLPADTVKKSLDSLPQLKRWRKEAMTQ
jgi:predicted amidophosphoribosyltransferase